MVQPKTSSAAPVAGPAWARRLCAMDTSQTICHQQRTEIPVAALHKTVVAATEPRRFPGYNGEWLSEPLQHKRLRILPHLLDFGDT
jgi:hypothetical protein